MINEKKKVGKIIDELVTFFLKKGHQDLVMDLQYSDTETTIILKIKNFTAEEYIRVNQCLAQPRDNTMEEYGWELLGESETSSELNLVGMCVDSFWLEPGDENITVLRLVRKN